MRYTTTEKRLSKFITLSLIVHLILLFSVKIPNTLKPDTLSKPLSLTKIETPQIVSLPEQSTERENLEQASLLSAKDSLAKREQLKKGITEPAQPKRSTAQNANQKQSSKKSQLLLAPNDYVDLLKTNSIQQNTKPAVEAVADENVRSATLEKTQPWIKISQSPDFHISTGSLDYLPNIPDGDITLLNTKADIFAVFVRRVALQVFATIRKNNWQQLSIKEISKLNQFVTIKATMSPQGKILSTTIVSSSNSVTFDNLVRDAVLSSAADPNPPAAAISTVDGNIQFIFKARTWSQRHATTFYEQRWLLLGTGLL
ncbi:MAG: TonB C-terminal domain-containing protein [Deltaproteobacteria bacterium]|jgi:TonB family protein|nr:TonB C-terminal domain-containing protein [Deltaproteobacteria bacterium]